MVFGNQYPFLHDILLHFSPNPNFRDSLNPNLRKDMLFDFLLDINHYDEADITT